MPMASMVCARNEQKTSQVVAEAETHNPARESDAMSRVVRCPRWSKGTSEATESFVFDGKRDDIRFCHC